MKKRGLGRTPARSFTITESVFRYRARAVKEPRALLAEFGTIIPENVAINVSDSTAMVRYLVLPQRPGGTEGFNEEQLGALVTRDAMIGVVKATEPSTSDAH